MKTFDTSCSFYYDSVSQVAKALRTGAPFSAIDFGAALATTLEAAPEDWEVGPDFGADCAIVASFWMEFRDRSFAFDEALMNVGCLRFRESLALRGYTQEQVDRAVEQFDELGLGFAAMELDDGLVVLNHFSGLVMAGDADDLIRALWDAEIEFAIQFIEEA